MCARREIAVSEFKGRTRCASEQERLRQSVRTAQWHEKTHLSTALLAALHLPLFALCEVQGVRLRILCTQEAPAEDSTAPHNKAQRRAQWQTSGNSGAHTRER